MINTDTESAVTAGSHNARLKSTLALIEQRVAHAKNDDQLVAAIKLLTPFSTPICYDNNRLNMVTGGICTAAAATALAAYLMALDQVLFVAAAIAALVALVVYAVIRIKRKTSLSGLSDKIHYQTSLFDYGLTPVSISGKSKARELGGRFQAFRHGNYSRDIRTLLRGSYKGAEHSFTYDHYHFHYVNQRTETYTTTDSKGNVRVRTRTVYDHFNRYGFILPFKFTKNLRISEGRLGFFKPKWKSISISFNKNFNVETASEMDAAKFLTPKMLVEIEAAGKALSGLDLEFNAAGDLCFSFDDSNTIAANRTGGLEQPAAFAEQISGHSTQANLDAALTFIHTLMKYSDNNFA